MGHCKYFCLKRIIIKIILCFGHLGIAEPTFAFRSIIVISLKHANRNPERIKLISGSYNSVIAVVILPIASVSKLFIVVLDNEFNNISVCVIFKCFHKIIGSAADRFCNISFFVMLKSIFLKAVTESDKPMTFVIDLGRLHDIFDVPCVFGFVGHSIIIRLSDNLAIFIQLQHGKAALIRKSGYSDCSAVAAPVDIKRSVACNIVYRCIEFSFFKIANRLRLNRRIFVIFLFGNVEFAVFNRFFRRGFVSALCRTRRYAVCRLGLVCPCAKINSRSDSCGKDNCYGRYYNSLFHYKFLLNRI